MKIKHIESGKVLTVLDGTKFAKSAYVIVDEKAEAPAAEAKEKPATKKKEDKAPKAEKTSTK